MKEQIRQLLDEIGLSLLKSLKVFVVYMLPSVVVAVLLSPELRDLIVNNAKLAGYYPIINLVLVAIAGLIKRRLPEDSDIKKVL